MATSAIREFMSSIMPAGRSQIGNPKTVSAEAANIIYKDDQETPNTQVALLITRLPAQLRSERVANRSGKRNGSTRGNFIWNSV